MDKDRVEAFSSVNENLAEENSSDGENSTGESNSMEEDSNEDDLDSEVSSSTVEGSMKNDLDLEEGTSSSDEDWAEEESSSTEDDSVEESSSAEEDSVEESSSTEEDSEEESSSTEEDSEEESSSTEEDSEKESSSTEEESSSMEESDEIKRNWIEREEHGLMLRDIGPVDRTVNFAIVGNEDCGKAKLIERVFGDHPSFTVRKYVTRIEYNISLCTHFHIWICDVKKTEFVKKETLSDKTVFLFCYDVDNSGSFANLQDIWIRTILEKSMKEMFYVLVGIKRQLKTQPKAKKLKKEDQKTAVEKKVKELNDRFRAGRIIECFIEDKHSLLNIFQSAINVVYPFVLI